MKRMLRILTALLIIGVFGCGSDSNEDSDIQFSRVVDIGAVEQNLQIGEGTVVAMALRFDLDDVAHGGRLYVLVRLGEGLALREGTSEVETVDGDRKVDASVVDCSTGESYVIYNLGRSDLDQTIAPSRDSNSKLKFTVDAVSFAGVTSIEAVAESTLPIFGCGDEFIHDDQLAMSVS